MQDDEEALLDDSGAEKTLLEEEELKPKRVRAKLLQFCENQRPPYWGTWTKRSKSVGPRRPFGQDKEAFDYEYDSDDDWEEEPAEGESLSDEEKDKEDEETEEERDAEEEEDDGFFVGHGVLDKVCGQFVIDFLKACMVSHEDFLQVLFDSHYANW